MLELNSEHKLNSLSERLVYTLNKLSVSQSHLAREIGVKPQVIQYLCSNNAQKSKFTYEIAHALNIDPHWLATGTGEPPLTEKTSHPYNKQIKIPSINWHDIKPWIDDPNSLNIKNYVVSHNIEHKGTFATSLDDKAMFPRFDINTTLIIDPNAEILSKSFVLAYIKEMNLTVLRELVIESNEKILYPMNHSLYKTIKLNDNDQILGTVVEARWKC